MSRASTVPRPQSPSAGPFYSKDTRSRDVTDARRASSRRAGSSVSLHAQSSALATTNPRTSSPTPRKRNTYSPVNHDQGPSDLLNDIVSVSSLASSAASVSSTPNSNMSYPAQAASLHTLTPLTSTDSSPPGKPPSPRSAQPSNETLRTTDTRRAPSAHSTTTMTPAHTPPEAATLARPTDRQNGILGMIAYYDPHLHAKDPKARKKGGHAKYKEIIEKVRYCDTHIPTVWSSCDAKANLTCVAGRPTSP